MNRLKSKVRTASNWTKVHWSWLLSGSITLLIALAILSNIFPESSWLKWTGFGEDTNESKEKTLQNGNFTVTKRIITVQSGKTLWDWLGLLGVIAIPFVLFQFQQQQQKKSEEQAEVEKEIADTNLREEALQDYIDKIAELLIDKELKVLLKKFSKGAIEKDDPKLDALLDVTRARTLSILRRLEGDGNRKGSVVHFLIDAELIEGLDLLMEANLSGANLHNADLTGANLSGADLTSANLINASLSGANLDRANLSGADLTVADLTSANLSDANLSHANLSHAQLFKATLSNTFLSGSCLKDTDFSEANLSGALLSEAFFLDTNLSSADLSNTDLSEVNFFYVKNLTPEQIKEAFGWEEASYDPDFRKQLGLPPQSNSQ
jgi:uncharacterized protein YjbI with pentapeptide repeats